MTLLEIIEKGTVGRFDNAKRPTVLPRGHAFSATCTCAECEHTWTAYDEAERLHEAGDAWC